MREVFFKVLAVYVLFFAALSFFVFLLYSPAIHGDFLLDDHVNIRSAEAIHLEKLDFDSIKKVIFESQNPSRVVPNLSFALNYYIHKLSPQGYRIVNIIIHIINGLLVFLLLNKTLKISLPAAKHNLNTWVALSAAVLWTVHPLQTQSVSYIVQRMNSMAALFYLLSLLLYIKGRTVSLNKGWYYFCGCLLSGFLAIISKENAVMLLVFVFLYEWYFFQNLSLEFIKQRAMPIAVAFVVFGIVILIFLKGSPVDTILGGYKSRDFTLLQRVFTEFRVVFFYIGLFFLPHPSRLSLEHDFSLSLTLFEPLTTAFAALGLLGLVIIAGVIAKKDKISSFSIIWLLGNLALESSFIGLELLFEHRMYLPSIFLSLMITSLLYRHIMMKWVQTAVISILFVTLSLWTYQRNKFWGNELFFLEDAVNKAPNNCRAHYNLANKFDRLKQYDEAIKYYKETVRLNPEGDSAHYAQNNLGTIYLALGNSDQAIHHFRMAVAIKPELEEVAKKNLQSLLNYRSRLQETINPPANSH
jgi:hypothetical protein